VKTAVVETELNMFRLLKVGRFTHLVVFLSFIIGSFNFTTG